MRFILASFFICLLLYGIKADWITSSPPATSTCQNKDEYSLSSSAPDVSLESLYNEREVPLTYPEWLHLVEQLNPPSNLSSSFIVYPVWDSAC